MLLFKDYISYHRFLNPKITFNSYLLKIQKAICSYNFGGKVAGENSKYTVDMIDLFSVLPELSLS